MKINSENISNDTIECMLANVRRILYCYASVLEKTETFEIVLEQPSLHTSGVHTRKIL